MLIVLYNRRIHTILQISIRPTPTVSHLYITPTFVSFLPCSFLRQRTIGLPDLGTSTQPTILASRTLVATTSPLLLATSPEEGSRSSSSSAVYPDPIPISATAIRSNRHVLDDPLPASVVYDASSTRS